MFEFLFVLAMGVTWFVRELRRAPNEEAISPAPRKPEPLVLLDETYGLPDYLWSNRVGDA